MDSMEDGHSEVGDNDVLLADGRLLHYVGEYSDGSAPALRYASGWGDLVVQVRRAAGGLSVTVECGHPSDVQLVAEAFWADGASVDALWGLEGHGTVTLVTPGSWGLAASLGAVWACQAVVQ